MSENHSGPMPVQSKSAKASVQVSCQAALCGLLLMSETTGDRLFRQIADTWLGLVEGDPLDDYVRYASHEEAAGSLDEAYLDRLEGD